MSKIKKIVIQEDVDDDLQDDLANEALEAEGDKEQDVPSEESQVPKMLQNHRK